MLDDASLEKEIQELLIDVCEVMYHKGFSEVSIGALMRLVGVAAERASKHDHDYFCLDEEFRKLISSRKKERVKEKIAVPSSATLH